MTPRRRILFGLFLLTLSTIAGSAQAADDLDGFYAVKGQNPNGKAYEATASITKLTNSYSLQWQFDGVVSAVGVGLRKGDTLAVIFQTAEGQIGLAIYVVKGKTLEGSWTAPGSDMVTGEVLTKTKEAPTPRGGQRL